MIVGHFFLAFTLGAAISFYLGLEKDKAVKVGTFAALFALLPDVDILYAFKEIALLLKADTSVFVESFWYSSSKLHRGVSHSILTGLIASVAFSFYHTHRSRYIAALAGLAAFLSGIYIRGFLVAALLVLYTSVGLFISEAGVERLGRREFVGSALLGLLSHPFGDLFTGKPPELFYPLSYSLVESRIIFFQDPVANLLSIFLIEVSTIAAAAIVFTHLRDISLWESFNPLVLMTVAFGAAYFFLPVPTLSSSYEFVYSLVSISIFAAFLSVSRPERLSVDEVFPFIVNFTAAALIGFFSYALVYLVFGF